MNDAVGMTSKQLVRPAARSRPVEVAAAGRPRPRRASTEPDSRRQEILRLLGAPVAREVEMYARMRGLRPVDVIRAAVSHYLRQPMSPPSLRATVNDPRPRRAS